MDGFSRSLGFFIGIDDYRHGVPKLKTPISDAKALADSLQKQHGFQSFVLTNKKATLEGIRRLLNGLISDDPKVQNELKQTLGDDVSLPIRDDDRVLLYFAGHGSAVKGEEGPEGFLLPQDADRKSDAKFLSMVEFNEALAKLKCRHLLVILDCCFAGAFRWSSTRFLSPRPPRLYQERYYWYIHGKAWQAIASAAHDERALDIVAGRQLGERNEKDADHSPFAEALLEGLSGRADQAFAGEIPDGVMTASDLFAYIEKRLMPAPGSRWMPQTPIFWPLKNHERGQFVFLAPGTEQPDLPPAPPLNEASNPWRGLNAYEQSDADLFFGRRLATEALRDRLLGKAATETEAATPAENFIVVTGPSGIGKSSLVRAGLLPCLAKDPRLQNMRCIVVSPGSSPLVSLAAALRRAINDATPIDEQALKTNPNLLADWVGTHGADRTTVLVVDQAEELITNARPQLLEKSAAKLRCAPYLAKACEVADGLLKVAGLAIRSTEPLNEEDSSRFAELDVAETFLAHVATALSACSNLKVVLAVRTEFEPQFAKSPLGDRWAEARYVVPQMPQDELRRVIEEPAAAKVMRFEDEALVNGLVNDVVQMPGALPLLSFALSEMYRNYLERRADDRSIAWVDYYALQGDGAKLEGNKLEPPKQIGEYDGPRFDAGVMGTLRYKANKFLDELDENYRNTARRILERLVAIEGDRYARRRVLRSEFNTSDGRENERIETIITRLVDKERLVVADELEGQASIELAHDALILGWDTLLNWVKHDAQPIRDLRKLTTDAEAWTKSPKERSGLLWTDANRLPIVNELLNSRFPGVNAVESQFARASKTRAKRNRKVRIAVVVFLLLVGLLIVWQRGGIIDANKKGLIEKSKQIARRARMKNDEKNFADAMLLSLSALPDNGVERPYLPEAEKELYRAYFNNREVGVLQKSGAKFKRGVFSRKGNWILSVEEGGTVTLWDIASDEKRRLDDDFKDAIFYGDDSKRIITSSEGRIEIRDAATHEVLNTWKVDNALVTSLTSSKSGKIAAVFNGSKIKIWDPISGEEYQTNLTVNWTIAFSNKYEKIVVATKDGKLRVLDATGQEESEFVGCLNSDVFSAEFSRNDEKIVVSCSDGKVRVIDVHNKKEGPSKEFDDPIRAVFSPVGERIVVASNKKAWIWDVETNKHPIELVGHTDNIKDVTFNTDGDQVLTASMDGTLRVWDARPDIGQAYPLEGHSGAVTDVAFSRDGKFIVTASRNGTARIWDTAGHAQINKLKGDCSQNCRLNSAAFSWDGKKIVTASSNGVARVWHCKSPEISNVSEGANKKPIDGDCKSPEILKSFEDPDKKTIKRAAFSPNGKHLVTATINGKVRLWDLATGNLIDTLEGDESTLYDAAFSPVGDMIVTASDNGKALIWDAVSRKKKPPPLIHEGKIVTSAAFSPDGMLIVTTAGKRAWIWDRRIANNPPTSLKDDPEDPITDKVFDAEFSYDGTRILTASTDGKVIIWDVKTYERVAVFDNVGGSVSKAAFSPDRRWIVVAFTIHSELDNVPRLQRVFPNTQEIVDTAKRCLPRCKQSNETLAQCITRPIKQIWKNREQNCLMAE